MRRAIPHTLPRVRPRGFVVPALVLAFVVTSTPAQNSAAAVPASVVPASVVPTSVVPTSAVPSLAQDAGVQQSAPASLTAKAFADTVGVNVHAYYSDTSYADPARMTALLQQLGVRHVRDQLVAGRPDQLAAIDRLGAAGITSELIVGSAADTARGSVDPAVLSALRTVAPHVDGVEPTNEYDCAAGFGSGWDARQRAYTQALATGLAATPATSAIDVLGPAWCRTASVAQFGAVPTGVDVVNAHNYSAFGTPELALEGRTSAWSAVQGAGKPMMITETGYQNALNSDAATGAVTEPTAADYTVRTLLDAARLGVRRTYLYELMDEKPDAGLTDPEQHYGLVRADGTPKPAFTAVRNLMSDVAAGTGTGTASTAVVSVRGGGSLLRTLRLGDSSGGGETLALWLARPLEQTGTHAALANPSARVQIVTGSDATATSRRPSRGNTATALGSGRSFGLAVDGAVTLVHLAPATTQNLSGACTGAPDYRTLAGRLGAIAYDDLAAGTSWNGAPVTATGQPDGVRVGSRITASGQWRRVAVPGAPASWTYALWQQTDPGAGAFSAFSRAVGVADAGMRTYDLDGDVPTRVQLSAYGSPTPSGAYAGEMWAQARPGTWHLLALSVSGGYATFSVDGVQQGRTPAAAAALLGVDVGALSSTYRGSLAGLSVFGRALTMTELAQLATASAGTCVPPTTATSSRLGVSAIAAVSR